MSGPRISVVVPCRNEGDGVVPTLERIVAQRDEDGRAFSDWAELIVTDDESSDTTPQVLARFQSQHPGVIVLRNEPRRGLSGSYNRAIHQSLAPIVLTCHSDCRMHGEDYLRRILAHFAAPDVAGVTGKPATPDYAALPFVEQLYILTHLMDVEPEPPLVRPINFLEGRCDGFRKQALLDVGLYDERTKISGEDQIIAGKLHKNGLRLIQDTSLIYTLSIGSSQDSVPRLIRRQLVLAEAQAYLLLRHDFHTSRVAGTTPNRLQRKRYRFVQATYPPTLVALLIVLSIFNWRAAVGLLIAAILWRLVYHFLLGKGRFQTGMMMRAFPVAVACDFAYAWGVVRGVFKAKFAKQIG